MNDGNNKIYYTKNKKSVVLVFSQRWSKRDYHRLGAEYLKKRGYDVRCISVGKKDDFIPTESLNDTVEYESIRNADFPYYANNNKDAIFVFYNNPEIFSVSLYKYDINYIVYGGLGLVCDRFRDTDYLSENSVSCIKKVILSIKKNKLKFPRRVYNRLKSDIPRSIRKLLFRKKKLPICVIMSTDLEQNCIPQEYLGGRVLYTHSYDYDRYIENKRNGISTSEDFIVFIEDGLIGRDRDHEINKLGNCINQEKWESECKLFFDKLEIIYGVPVVVAGHPHSVYNDGKFAGRDIILGKTTELIPKAKLVVTQISTVFSMVNLYQKDFIFALNNDVQKQLCSYEDHYVRWYSYFIELMNVKVLNFDETNISDINIEKYVNKYQLKLGELYKNRYIKMDGTCEELNCEILEKVISEIPE